MSRLWDSIYMAWYKARTYVLPYRVTLYYSPDPDNFSGETQWRSPRFMRDGEHV